MLSERFVREHVKYNAAYKVLAEMATHLKVSVLGSGLSPLLLILYYYLKVICYRLTDMFKYYIACEYRGNIEFCVSELMAMWLLNRTHSNFCASFNFNFVLAPGIMTKHVQL